MADEGRATLNYSALGQTAPASEDWSPIADGYRRFEGRTVIATSPESWNDLAKTLMTWGVKTRSGFAVEPEPGRKRVESGDLVELVFRVGPLRVREPVRVMDVVNEPERVGFSYGTRHGHPVAGEEAFILERSEAGAITLIIRSLNKAPRGPWRLAYPIALLLQPRFRRRYARSLTWAPRPQPL